MPQTFSARAEIRTRDHCLQTLRYCSQHHEDVGDRRWTFLSFMSHYSHIHSEEKKAKLKFPDGFEPATFSFEGEAMSTKPRLLLEIQLKIFQLNKGTQVRTAVLPTDGRFRVHYSCKLQQPKSRYLVVAT